MVVPNIPGPGFSFACFTHSDFIYLFFESTLKETTLCIYLCIFGCASSSLLHRLFSRFGGRGYYLVVVWGLLVAMVSLVAASRLWSTGLIIVVQGLSCSEACGIFPEPGIEPVYLALAGRFFTTEPPRKPKKLNLKNSFIRNFPDSPVVPLQGPQVQSLVWELKSCKAGGMAKKKLYWR